MRERIRKSNEHEIWPFAVGHNLHASLMISICMKNIESLSSRLLTAAAGPLTCHAGIKNMHKNLWRWTTRDETLSTAADEKLRGGLLRRTSPCNANRCHKLQIACHAGIKIYAWRCTWWTIIDEIAVCCGIWVSERAWCTGRPYAMLTAASSCDLRATLA